MRKLGSYRFQKMAFSVLVLAGFCGLQGCVTMEKATGTKETYLNGNPEVAVNAITAALEELKLRNIHGVSSMVDGSVEAVTAQGKEVRIKVKSAGDNSSSMLIRVGAFGDDDISQAIIETTQKKLAAPSK